MTAGSVDGDSIAAAVRAAGATAISSIRDVPTVSGNLVFEVHTHDGVRLAVRFPKNAKAIVREQRISERLRGLVPVPHVLLADSSGVSAGHPVQVSQWVEGERLDTAIALNSEVDKIGLGRAVGMALARLAGVELAMPGWLVGTGLEVERRERRLADGIRRHVHGRLFSTDGHTLALDIRRRFWRLVESRVDALAVLEGERSLVHGDLIQRNVLVRREDADWAVVAVLDWEFALSGPTLRDVGNVMRGAPPTFAVGLETGLRSGGRTLPEDWRELAWLLDTVSLTGSLTRTNRHPDRLVAERLIADVVHASREEQRPG